MGSVIKILGIFYLVVNATACQKDNPPHNNSKLTISNLKYTPDTVIINRSGDTFHIQGSIDFSNAAGGVAELRFTNSAGSDLTVKVSSNAQANGTLSAVFEVAFPTEAGNFTFQIWVIDNAGNVSNKLHGSVQAIIDDEGKNWVNVSSPLILARVIWANQRFIAVGMPGLIATSTDPTHSWTQFNYGTTNTWLIGVAWSGSLYIVVGENTILSSPDGVAWTSRFSSLDSFYRFSSVAWSGKGFVAAGESFFSTPYYSPRKTAIFNSADGYTWTENTFSIAESNIYNIIWANNQYVAVGDAIILTSPDGLTWTNRSGSVSPGSLIDVTWTGTKYVGVGPNLAATSSDGITWNVNDTISWNPMGVTWSGHQLIACGDNGFYSSTDGLNWSQTYFARYPLFSIAWSGFQYVSVGPFAGQTILVSPY